MSELLLIIIPATNYKVEESVKLAQLQYQTDKEEKVGVIAVQNTGGISCFIYSQTIGKIKSRCDGSPCHKLGIYPG